MKTLEIFLGIYGDNPVLHKYSSSPGCYAGKIVVGPNQFLAWLELHLGLGGLFPTETERVLLLKEKLNELTPDRFMFHTSFKNDPLGVSKRLLNLWDSWRMSGWDGKLKEGLPRRMNQLAKLSEIFSSAGTSVVDRLLIVTQALTRDRLPVCEVELLNDISQFPFLFQQLIQRMKETCPVRDVQISPLGKDRTNLRMLQNWLVNKKMEGQLHADDTSVVILQFPNDIDASNAVYSIQRSEGWNPVIVNTDNSLLNGLHLSHRTPVCKWETVAGNGQVSQLFFLATAMFQRPVKCKQVLSFLASPILPFSKELARNLSEAFSSQPGFGCDEWTDAITEYLQSINGKERERTKKESVKFWLQNERTLQDDAFEVALLKNIYQQLDKWASTKMHLDFYKRYAEQLANLTSLCRQLLIALEDEGEIIAPAKFERLLSELFIDSPVTIADAEVGCADAVSAPGCTWSEVKELLWMNAARFEPANYLSKYWYQQEKLYFLEQGLPVHDEQHASHCYNEGLRKMVLNTSERMVIVVPGSINGVKAARPYCLDEWSQYFKLDAITYEESPLLQHVPWNKAQNLTATPGTISLPEPTDYIEFKGEGYSRKIESFSSIEKLIQHPAEWYFRYRLGLKYRDGIDLPDERTLRGTIADVVVQQLFKQENKLQDWWNDDKAFSARVIQTSGEVIEQQGLPFLETSSGNTLHEYKQQLERSLASLKKFVDDNGFSIVGTQQKVTGKIDNTDFEGDMDLLLRKEEKQFVIDLKWAGSSKRYKDKLAKGTDLQLALYQSMQGAAGSGYFLLNEGKMYMREEAAHTSLLHATLIKAGEGISTIQVYEKAVNSLQYRREEIRNGNLETGYCYDWDGLEYHTKEQDQHLIPLEADFKNKKYKRSPYDNHFDLLFGNIQ